MDRNREERRAYEILDLEIWLVMEPECERKLNQQEAGGILDYQPEGRKEKEKIIEEKNSRKHQVPFHVIKRK